MTLKLISPICILMSQDKLSFGFDLERIIDDWVLMGFLVGNDFLPHLPNMHIRQVMQTFPIHYWLINQCMLINYLFCLVIRMHFQYFIASTLKFYQLSMVRISDTNDMSMCGRWTFYFNFV